MCLHPCVCACLNALCMRISVGISVYVCVHVCLYLSACMYTCVLCVRVYVFMCVYMCVYTCECMCEYAYVCVLLSITRCRNAVLNAGEWRPHSWESRVWAAPRALSSFSFTFRGSGSDSPARWKCQGGSFLRQRTVTFCLRNYLRGEEVWDGEGESACGKGTPCTRRRKTGRAWDEASESTSGKWGDLIP